MEDHQYINYPNNNNSNDNDSKGKEREDLTNETIKIWEFKHSAGIFKKGDVEGLKLIKRRSSSRNISAMNQKKNLVSMQLNSSINNNVMPANTFMEANNDKKNRAPFGRPNNGNEPMIQGDLGINAGHFPYSQRVQQPQAQPQKHIQYQRYPYTPYSSVDSNTYQNNRRKQLNMSPNQYNEEDESSTHGKFSVSEIDDLRSINQDMAKLIGFMEYFVTLHLDSGKYKIDDDPQKQNWENFQNELANFKNNVIKRLHTKLGASHLLQEQYQRQVQQQQFLKDKIYPRQPEPLLPHHHHSHPILVTHPIGSSMSASQMVPIRPHTAPVAAIPSLLSSGQSYYGSTNNLKSVSNPNNPQMSMSRGVPPNQIMQNPFERTNNSISTKRNQSVLLDPLTPVVSVSSNNPMRNRVSSLINTKTQPCPIESASNTPMHVSNHDLMKTRSQSSLYPNLPLNKLEDLPSNLAPITSTAKDSICYSKSTSNLPNAGTVPSMTGSAGSPLSSLLNEAAPQSVNSMSTDPNSNSTSININDETSTTEEKHDVKRSRFD